MEKVRDNYFEGNEVYPHLESIFDTLIDGIVIIDTRGTIQAANPAITDLFGYGLEELLGRNVSVLMPSPYAEAHDGYLESYLRTGVKKIIGMGREVEGRRKDGSVFPIRLSISESVIKDRIYFTGIIHDISEIVAARAELEMVNRQLEKIVGQRTEEITKTVNRLLRANQQLKEEIERREKTEHDLEVALEREKDLVVLKSQFVTMASHEFRTPLSTILSSASIIQRYRLEEEQEKREKHISKIKASVKNMTHILEDVLSLGKLEEGKIDIKPEPFDLPGFIREIGEQLNAILKDGQEIILDCGEDVGEVTWDLKLTENILNNLLSNAIKYSGENKPVHVAVSRGGETVTIAITDQGIGIPLEQQKYLFSRFFRATNALNIKGTGLGLHIVREYLALMNGSITFESREGQGTTFTITIPVTYT